MSRKKTIVISQPMLFPWVGLFEQICLADVFIFYDDVQFSKGSFTNRVQLKCEKGSEWMTIPLKKFHLGQNINEILVSEHTDWRRKHLNDLKHCYGQAEYFEEMFALVKSVYSIESNSLSEITIASMKAVCEYFGLSCGKVFITSSESGFNSKSSERVLDYVLFFKGARYVTGHGAKNYLNHESFVKSSVDVQYMDYEMKLYPQLFSEFTPFVSILDLIANCGKNGSKYLCSGTMSWCEMLSTTGK